MGGSTVVIAPLDGDMTAYLASLDRLASESPPIDAIAPGHGPLLFEPAAVLEQYLSHRKEREEAVLAALVKQKRAFVSELVEDVYVDTPPALHPVARYSVWAHLRKLASEGRASTAEPDDIEAEWTPAS